MSMSSLADCRISVVAVLIWLLGTAGMSVIFLACVGLLAHPFATFGLSLIVLACTAQCGHWVRRLDGRLQDAFELGQDAAVSQIRRP